MKFQLALLLVGAFFMAPTPGLAQAPNSVDYSTLTGEVVNLVRLRLLWAVPTGPVTGYNISCGADMCSSIVVVPTPVGGRVSSEILHTADVNSTLQVFIATMNSEGTADAGAGKVLPVATFDDARPIVNVTVLTVTFLVLDWTLPQTAMGDGISVMDEYTIDFRRGSTISRRSPLIVDGLVIIPFRGMVQMDVIPTYVMPTIANANDVMGTISRTIPGITGVQPILNSNAGFMEGLNSTVTVSWQPPPVTGMLDRYVVSYQVIDLVNGSVRSDGGMFVSTTSTSFGIEACPYCEVVVDVNVDYTGNNRARLLPTSRYVTRQASPSAPRSLNVVKSGVRDLTVTWETPSSPNGVIRNYIVSYTTGGNTRREEVGSNATTYILRNLLPNTEYSIVITGFTAAEDGSVPSGAFTQTTGFGVTSPSSVSVDNLDVTFTLEFDDGPVGHYVIVLSTSFPGNTSSRSTIPAYTTSADFYGTRAADVTGTPSAPMTVTIGSGMTTSGGGVSYMDTSLQSSTDYYVFVRAFSSVNETQYSDSAVVSFRTGSGTNIVAIVVPIVIVYILLMVVLIVLGVLAYIYVGKAYKLRKRYQRRKQEAAKRQQQAAAMNLVSGEEGGKDGSASPAPKAEDDPNVQVEVDVEDEKMADQQAEGTNI